ncbi:MAG: YkgJ family cysteine cluster protein [Pirellulaceae bacterium]|nr:YkgJ family cysteine cluster protein [Pirellulaceae bacterium]
MTEKPWYSEGLRFECTGCGACCGGAPGYIWVNQAEIVAMAEALGISAESFEAMYVRAEGRRRTLKERANGDCVMLDGEMPRCRVYDARPRQCRSWPFWSSNLRTPDDWERTCRDCPGAGKGTRIPLERIEDCRGLIQI